MVTPELSFFSAGAIGQPPIIVPAGGMQRGFFEGTTYTVEARALEPCRIFVDDAPLQRDADTGRFFWHPEFYAGQVEVCVVEKGGQRHSFWLDVSPTLAKLGQKIFSEMMEEVKAFNTGLILGSSAATRDFGSDNASASESPLVTLARLRKYGPAFLDAAKTLAVKPHRRVQLVSKVLPLSAIRRIHPSALNNSKLLAAVAKGTLGTEELESIRLPSHVPMETVDTPANRAVKGLLMRFRAAIRKLSTETLTNCLGGEPEEQGLRRPWRLQILTEMDAAAEVLLKSAPFRDVTKVEASASGLTQLSALPAYSRTYRLGCQALRMGVAGEAVADAIPISPTYNIFESWCFVRLYEDLGRALGIKGWTKSTKAVAGAQFSYEATLSHSVEIQLLFQARFPSTTAPQGRCCFSISRERIPDILVVVKSAKHVRALVLDAKYRSGRANVLEAMESAHLYHDSLRIASRPPEVCLLLLPGAPDVPTLHHPDFWAEHHVGAIGNFRPNAGGLSACLETVVQWAISED